MSSQFYSGPVYLGASRYAIPAPNTASPNPASSGAIATKQQVAATASPKESSTIMTKEDNPDAQLAMAQARALKQDVDKHAAQFSRSVGTAFENTHRLLNLIRDSIKKDGPTAEMKLQTVDNLWMELEHLFKAANEAKTALPEFIAKHQENMSLYHHSMLDEIIRESQEELKLQHKKVNIQHSLTLEHQQAFQDYKARTDSKLENLNELQGRVERLQLEQGLFKGEISADKAEIEKYKKLLDEANTNHDKIAQTVHDLQKELSDSQNSNNELATNNKALGFTIEKLEESLKTAEHRVMEAQEDLKQKGEALAKATHEQGSLRSMHKALVGTYGVTKKEIEDLKAEIKRLQEKFKNQGSEYSKLFAQSGSLENKAHGLEGDVSTLKQENETLKSKLAAQAELEKTNQSLTEDNHSLEKEVTALKAQVSSFEEQASATRNEIGMINGKVKRLEKENDELETINNGLVETIKNRMKFTAAFDIIKEENIKLRATVEELQKKPVVAATAPADEGAMKDLQEQVRQSAEKTTSLEKSVEEWVELASRSYAEYKQILPTYKKAETYRKECLDKDKEIANLQTELQAAKAPKQANGDDAGTGGDAAYWKDKYESLLATVST